MNLATYIDHTILKPDTRMEEVRQVCEEAVTHQFAAVCIPPYFVKNAYQLLENSPVKVATVIGFPMGYSATFAKVEEIKRAIDEGADEVDVVINLCAVKSQNWNYVRNDIASMTAAAHLKAKKIKVILETGLLTDDEILGMAGICREFEPDFVKTSTGFNGGGATLRVVEMLKQELSGTPIKIKASGGIRSAGDARAMIEAGAERLGSSSGVGIVKDS